MRQSAAATFTFELGESREAGGMEDYAGPMRPDLRLEDLSHALLVRQAKEFALDVHLLMRAAYFSVDENFGPELLDEVAPQHRAAIAPVLVARLREALGIEGDDMAAIGKVLQVDPFLVDDYVDYSVEVRDEASGSISFSECAGIGDDACRSPLDWLDGVHPHGPGRQPSMRGNPDRRPVMGPAHRPPSGAGRAPLAGRDVWRRGACATSTSPNDGWSLVVRVS